ncbi:hypothetical protein B5X24_HaOG203207 [Helicoverpa armigera]|uniref:Uncharacterized protein n=1 Tax=Helicoverpa armigera TaxID=29058 RepID=A0A2W1BVC8_HELAM|nr:hypothetical protein B5X24_HaOG203207 [Helicoverpa armigera]
MEVITLLVLIALGAAGARNIPSRTDSILFIDDQQTETVLSKILFNRNQLKHLEKEEKGEEAFENISDEDNEDRSDEVVPQGINEVVDDDNSEAASDENRIVFKDEEEDVVLVPEPTTVNESNRDKLTLENRTSFEVKNCPPGKARMGSLCMIIDTTPTKA